MQKKTRIFSLLVCLSISSSLFANVYDFEMTKAGEIPKGWHCSQRYGQEWSVELKKDASKHSTHVLSLLKTDAYGSNFNTCYKDAAFLNGTISLKFKADAGRGDQGGGIMWRVKDADNYYVVRFNPLEDNLRLYSVKDGNRRMLKGTDVHLDAAKWHTLKVVQQGADYVIALDGKKLLQGSDMTFPHAGGVGVWSKADALTSFDDLEIVKR